LQSIHPPASNETNYRLMIEPKETHKFWKLERAMCGHTSENQNEEPNFSILVELMLNQ